MLFAFKKVAKVKDFVSTVAAILTFINPLLYNYYGIRLATMNNLVIGGLVCLFAIYVGWKDSDRLS
jgi:hypothetical protein